MKRLAHRTGSAVGAASQGAITRQQMQELLIYATGAHWPFNVPGNADPRE